MQDFHAFITSEILLSVLVTAMVFEKTTKKECEGYDSWSEKTS